MENKKLHLNKVKLSGFKSIKNVEVDINEGLNIIIGKNAAGKTNFLTFLYNQLTYNYDEFSQFKSELNFSGFKNVSITSELNSKIDITTLKKEEVNLNVLVNKKTIRKNELHLEEIFFNTTFIRHGLPSIYNIVDKPYKFVLHNKNNSIVNELFDPNIPFFIKSLLYEILNETNTTNNTVSNLKTLVSTCFSRLENLKLPLLKFSPIEDIRIHDDFNIFSEINREGFSISNLFLELKINNQWRPFSELSDGTKRLFYIISEIGYQSKYHFSNDYVGGGIPENRIILIEEPELGIHPHQLMKLMQFIKEASREHQIIVTTHSPLVLDVLNENELDNIIIAYTDTPKEGTKLRHLNESEITKAQSYMKEDYLSDYWKYSDLEN